MKTKEKKEPGNYLNSTVDDCKDNGATKMKENRDGEARFLWGRDTEFHFRSVNPIFRTFQ